MWLRNIYTKTLRDMRAGVLGWGISMALLVIVGASQYTQLFAGVGPERQKLINEAMKAFQAFGFLLGEITDLGTIGGFLTTRLLGFIPVVMALWAAVMGVGAIRGEEQAGTMELLLSTPNSRSKVFRSKALGLFTSVGVLVLLLGVGIVAGVAAAGETANVALANIGETTLNFAGVCCMWGGIGLLVGQLVGQRRTASTLVGAFVFGTFLMDNILTSNPSLKWLAWLSPFHYYSISKPLAPGRIMESGGWLAMAALTLAFTALAGVLFTRRDSGAVFKLLPARRAGQAGAGKESNGRLLRSPLEKSLRDLLWPTILWGVGLGIYGAMILGTAQEVLAPVKDMLANMGWMTAIVGTMATPEAYLSYGLFTFLPVLLAVYAVLQVNAWADDEEEGRMETLTTMPVSRWGLLVPRYVAFAVSLLVIVLIIGLFLWATSELSGTRIALYLTVGALLGSLPVAMVVLALGLCIATWLKRPAMALPVTSALVAAMFFLDFLAPVFKLPEAVTNLSVFHLYGRPLMEGLKAGGVLALVVAALLLAAASLAGFQRRDIVK